MKTTNFLFSIVISSLLFSCKKDCDKDPVETPVECTSWNKLLGGTQTDLANASVRTPDGGYIVVGSTQSNDGDVTGYKGGIDLLVFKVDKNGNKIWQKAFGGSGQDIGNSVVAAPDGGYVIAGATMSGNGDVVGSHGDVDAWVLKIDEQGNKLWQKAWGGTNGEWAYSVTSVADGYVVAMVSGSKNGDLPVTNEGGNSWIVKFAANGIISWQKPVGVDFFDDAPFKIISVSDGFLIAGTTSQSSGTNARVVKTNTAGDVVWQKTFGGSDHEVFSDIIESANGGYILTGYTDSGDGEIVGNTKGDYDLLVVKVDGSGNKEWLKIFEGAGVDGLNGTSVIKTSDAHYVIATSTSGHNPDAGAIHGAADVWVLKLTATGNKVAQKLLGGTENENIGKLIQASDCGYILTGSSFSNNGDVSGNHSNGFSDVWINKISGL
jgi:hypothetical protein